LAGQGAGEVPGADPARAPGEARRGRGGPRFPRERRRGFHHRPDHHLRWRADPGGPMRTKSNIALTLCLLGLSSARSSYSAERGAAAFAPGKIVDGKAANGVTYHVRLPPAGQTKGAKARNALVILHGSSMNSR